MKNLFSRIYEMFRPAMPVFFVLLGGIGIIYSVGTGKGDSPLVIIGLFFMLTGVSFYTYQQAVNSELFKRRFGQKDERSKRKNRRRSGKRCPQCSRVIYHRRAVCQHCGYKFSSYKEEPSPRENSPSKSDSP